MALGGVDRQLQLPALLLLLPGHAVRLVRHPLRHEQELHERLALSKNMTPARRGRAEDHEELPRPPVRLHVPDDRQRHRARVVREEPRVRLRADHVAGRRLQVEPRVEHVKLRVALGRERNELAAAQLRPRLLGVVPIEAQRAAFIDDVALGLVLVDQLQAIGRCLDEREAMPRLRLRAVHHLLGRARPPRLPEPNRLRRQGFGVGGVPDLDLVHRCPSDGPTTPRARRGIIGTPPGMTSVSTSAPASHPTARCVKAGQAVSTPSFVIFNRSRPSRFRVKTEPRADPSGPSRAVPRESGTASGPRLTQ